MLHSPLVIVVFALLWAMSNGLHVNTDSSVVFTQSSDTVYPEPWISDLFYQALENFNVRNVGSTVCREQADMYEKNLRNHTNWAVKMSESWDRRPVGILVGNRYHFGIYDECVGVRYPIKGQYCMSEIKLRSTVANNNSSNKNDNLDRVYNSDAWKTVLEWNNYPDQVQRNVLNLGICIPDSCTASDLQTSLQKELNKVFLSEKVNAIVKVEKIMCTVREDKYPYNTAFLLTCAIFGILVTICCATTIHHYIKLSSDHSKTEARENLDSYLYSFSFIRSINDLLNYNKDNELNFVYGFKAILMMFVLFVHRLLYLTGNPLIYTIFEEDMLANRLCIFVLTLMNAIDSFFFISGFLLSYLPSSYISGPVWMKLAFQIINRIVRLLPAHCALIIITAHIIPHLGDGPLWPLKIWEEADNCKSYWWANLLFINNFIDAKYQCLITSWYISCDIQFYIVGTFVVYVFMKNTKYGIRLLITILGLSFIVPFTVIFFTEYDGFLKIDVPLLENLRSSVTFDKVYRVSYMRSAPYFMGLTMGFVATKLKNKKFKLSQMSDFRDTSFILSLFIFVHTFRRQKCFQSVIYSGAFVIAVIFIGIHSYGIKFYTRHRPYYPLERALYSAFSLCTWSMIGAWIVICHFTTGDGLLIKFVSNRILVILGKLSYSLMLVNLTVMITSQSSQRSSYNFSIKSMLDECIHDSFKCYLVGLMLYLIVEAPFGIIFKNILRRRKKKIISNTKEPSEENSNYLSKFKKTFT